MKVHNDSKLQKAANFFGFLLIAQGTFYSISAIFYILFTNAGEDKWFIRSFASFICFGLGSIIIKLRNFKDNKDD